MSYTYKTRDRLAYDANMKRLRVEGRIVLDDLLNEAIAEMDRQFDEAMNRGEILEIGGSAKEMKAFLRVAAQRQLGTG